MFCPKCGAEIPENSAFCSTCGEKFTAEEIDALAASPAKGAVAFGTVTNWKDPATIIKLVLSLLSFIFGFLPLWKVSVWGFSKSYTVLRGNMFGGSFFLGMSQVFMIISIVLFAFYVVSILVDFNKFLKVNFSIARYAPLAYFIAHGASLIFLVIGTIIQASVVPAVCWYFAMIFCALNFVLYFVPTLLDKVFKK